MPKVFSTTVKVIAWLGVGNDQTEIAIDALNNFSPNGIIEARNALFRLWGQPYWKMLK